MTTSKYTFLVRVVVDDPHEVVEKFTDEQLVCCQDSRLPGSSLTKVRLGLQTSEEEDGGEALLHEVRGLPVCPGVVGDEVVGCDDVTGVVLLLSTQPQTLIVLLQPRCQVSPLLETPGRQDPVSEEPGPAAAPVETILEETLRPVASSLGSGQAGGRTEPASSMAQHSYKKYQEVAEHPSQ